MLGVFVEGDRVNAHAAYETACRLLQRIKPDSLQEKIAVRKAYAINRGNQAAVCMRVHHGGVVRVK